jgi:hypothetical protein
VEVVVGEGEGVVGVGVVAEAASEVRCQRWAVLRRVRGCAAAVGCRWNVQTTVNIDYCMPDYNFTQRPAKATNFETAESKLARTVTRVMYDSVASTESMS